MTPTMTKSNSWYHFQIVTKEDLSERDCELLQQEHGYHPGGYGFYGFNKSINTSNGMYVYNWKCSLSCD